MGEQVQKLYWTTMESPIGDLAIGATERGVCFIEFVQGDFVPNELVWIGRTFGEVEFIEASEPLAEARKQLKEYFAGQRQKFTLPLDLYGTEFQKKVWNQLILIPYGEVRSYKQIAEAIGQPKAVRAVGGANNKNPVPIVIPCHRVVGSDGSLVGYGGGLWVKEKLLELEGSLRKTPVSK
jgi:O-6-methylguanine DNA methyltransferase